MWETLEEFVDWYKAEGFPMRPPFEEKVYNTDISMSYVLYREGRYQAELYLVKPNTESPEHSHPGIENMIMVDCIALYPLEKMENHIQNLKDVHTKSQVR